MATEIVTLNNLATIVLSQSSTNTTPLIFSVENSTIQNRVLYVKEAGISPGNVSFDLSGMIMPWVDGSSNLAMRQGAALTLHQLLGQWHILGGFYTYDSPTDSLLQFSTQQQPVNSTPIYPSMRDSRYFIDLRTESKTVVLPPIKSIPGIGYDFSPIYTFKDVYGNAAKSSLFISSSGNALLESDSIDNSTKLDSNYASLDLFANVSTNRWHFVNYYNGSTVTNLGQFQDPTTNTDMPSTIYISTSLTYVTSIVEDITNPVQEVNKVTMLPVAGTVLGQTFYLAEVGDLDTTLSYNLISTQTGDFIDDKLSSIFFYTPFTALQLVAQSSTRYSLITDWTLCNVPFQP